MSQPADAGTIWLSGAILTFLNKLLLPVLWLILIAAYPLWVFAIAGRIRIAPSLELIACFLLIATVPLAWFTFHLQRVGYSGQELVVANYWREARIPFENIQAVEPVWWYKGRLVRVRFAGKTPFGSMVYYMPKWGPVLAMIARPEEQLQRVIGHVDHS